ncbi:hypothetical protein BLNAU_21474 [Blattamonas nauphoetae]|uniref:Uncharacterized protein n=1 Tax=Blattamonas nauphoetae TaxID=2049346 RepID=A0ABQ9WVR9_9EUKA|nr:hypothetical protein BLNAU_21474 [Blattamonas nauphoetae]
MLDEKVETAPSEYEKPKSKASAKLSKSPAKEKKGKEELPSKDIKPAEEPHETERSTVHQVVLQTFLNDLIDTVVQRCSADTSPPPQEHSIPHVKPAKAVLDETVRSPLQPLCCLPTHRRQTIRPHLHLQPPSIPISLLWHSSSLCLPPLHRCIWLHHL